MKKPAAKTAPVEIRLRLRIAWRAETALGPGKAELLARVAATGSIREAAKQMGMSYMKAWLLVQTMNRCFKEPVLVVARGGTGGGGATLTSSGRKALAIYQKMESETSAAAQRRLGALRRLLRK